eukprot:Plantae.Rhodophyta-Palmaria_palmata.ctg7731.p1 GENE.Plantae.Rhodophyta-Palmaria_palmata.ctg7731~~Plantae.Rhodophyta-Palmaria_palmata.ctg7731.p1  ORF type:complete len:392 (+),score=25.81 Plantae.Rhodophyta-Palmaria_palmata.ctg7731:25-1176(+)
MEALAMCFQLQHLSLHGLPELQHSSLVCVLRSTTELRSLSLGYLRHHSLSSATLGEIARCCRKLDTVLLYDTRWAPVLAVVSMCHDLGGHLRSLHFHSIVGLSNTELTLIVRGCPNLISLSVTCDEAGLVTGEAIVAATKALSPNLLALEVSGETVAGLGDEELQSIVENSPRLQSLSLRHSHITDFGLSIMSVSLCKSLRRVDLGGCISDRGVIALGKCRLMESFSLTVLYPSTIRGATGHDLPHAAGGGVRSHCAVSNAGLDGFLCGAGHFIQRFEVSSLQSLGPGYRRHESVGSSAVSHIACVDLYRSLAQHCSPCLRVVSLQKLCPPLSAKKERAQMELRMFELEEACPSAVVWADREPPLLFPLSVDSLLRERARDRL